MKKQSPMLFKEPLIIATLQGVKDHTMRCTGLDRINESPDRFLICDNCYEKEGLVFFTDKDLEHSVYLQVKCPYGNVCDLIYVKETHMYTGKTGLEFIYKAGYPYNVPVEFENVPEISCIDWKSPLYMPKEAARIWLEITDIKLRRVQEVTAEIALREGIGREKEPETGRMIYKDYSKNHKNKPFQHWNDPVTSWITLWDSINGKRKPGKPDLSYKANPWAWFISYKKIQP